MTTFSGTREIELLREVSDLRRWIDRCRRAGQSIGLVPTMGALHAGHLSLVDACRRQCDQVVVSIFVNPTQFAPHEDLGSYPRDLDTDVRLVREHRADLVFAPDNETMYPVGSSTFVEPPEISRMLEGEHRPHHFRGVATVVLKLFNLVAPDIAFFGQKDFQQTQVVRTMVRDLHLDIQIVDCPIVRDSDGLALSSRNAYLDRSQRDRALALSRCLDHARQAIEQGETDSHALMAEMNQMLIEGGVSRIDYAVVADPETLQVQQRIRPPAVLLVAAYVDDIRLIDNCWITG